MYTLHSTKFRHGCYVISVVSSYIVLCNLTLTETINVDLPEAAYITMKDGEIFAQTETNDRGFARRGTHLYAPILSYPLVSFICGAL